LGRSGAEGCSFCGLLHRLGRFWRVGRGGFVTGRGGTGAWSGQGNLLLTCGSRVASRLGASASVLISIFLVFILLLPGVVGGRSVVSACRGRVGFLPSDVFAVAWSWRGLLHRLLRTEEVVAWIR
jgi:hypothetical protein